MTRPRRKRVSNDVFRRISEALEDIAGDPEAPRTKREIERRSGLAHDTVARAFRQDAEEDNEWRVNQRLDALTGSGSSRRSPVRQRQVDAEQKVADLRQRLAEAERTLDRYAMALFAYYVSTPEAEPGPVADAVPIGRNRVGNARRR